MEKIEKILAKNLLQLRQKNNWTQKDLSERTNIARTDISKYESGKNNTPNLTTVEKFAAGFNCSVADLLNDPSQTDNQVHIKLSPDQQQLLDAYNQASPKLKVVFNELIKACLDNN